MQMREAEGQREARATGVSGQRGSVAARRVSALTALTALSALTAGCGGARGAAGPNVRDSAGVRIVEYAAWAPQPLAWRIGDQPLVEIGAIEGDDAYQFEQVQSARRLRDGRIVVANGGSQEIRFFDATGRHLLTVGREGEGPGEFRGLGPVEVLPGDSVAAYDWSLRRVSVYAPNGTFARSFPLDFTAGALAPVGSFPDGGWLTSRSFVFGVGDPGTAVVQDTNAFLVFDPTGTLTDSIGRFPSFQYYVRTEGSSAMAVSLPFGLFSDAAVAGNGFYAGYAGAFAITRYARHGAPELVIRAARDPRPVTQADVAALKDERLEDAPPEMRPGIERLYADMPVPAAFPAFGDLKVDAEGHLWVADYRAPDEEHTTWTVFDAQGTLLGTIRTPPGLTVMEIGTDYLLGTWADDLDVPYVRIYRLTRTGE